MVNDSQIIEDQEEEKNGSIIDIKNEFFGLKIKKQIYLGKPAIAVYVSHLTKKIKLKLAKLQRQEELQEQVQTESYKSTIGHELRTPLNSSSFIVQRIISIVS